jgi:hypothetical protein
MRIEHLYHGSNREGRQLIKNRACCKCLCERIESSVQAVAEESWDKRDLIAVCDVSLR